MKSAILAFFIFLLTASNGYAASNANGIASASSEQKELFEFKFTDDELKALSKWKSKSFDDMLNDAFNCDSAAIYMIGMTFLTGSTGLAIDVEKADFWFSRSASFGFAPALKQIIHKNIENENIFLILVYSNLMASLGHSEYIVPYHELRTKAINTFGSGISKEIERIAACKKEQISNNIEKLRESEDRQNLLIEMTYDGTLIDYQDDEFNQDYWLRFTKFQQQSENEARKFQEVLNIDFQELRKLYAKSKENLSITVDKLSNEKSINELKNDFLKDAKKAIGKTEEFITLMEDFQNASNENLRKLAKEFLLLGQNIRGVLEQHCNFFLSPHQFLESDAYMNKFEEYTAGVDEHSENIEELIKKLN